MNTVFNSREIKEFRRVCIRSTLLILPFIALIFLELFVLPIDFFTFRIWEAASSSPYQYPGPFYPNLHVKKQEYGDSYRYGVAESKSLEWYTDSYGWRNRPEIEKRKKYDAIIIGDSNMVGSFLDQKDTLAEVLSRRFNKTVYSYASGIEGISVFFSDPRPKLKTADLLIFELKAGYWFKNNLELQNFKELPDGSLELRHRTTEFSLENNHRSKFELNLRILRSRIKKQAMWHAARAELAVNFFLPNDENSVVYIGKTNTHFFGEKKSWRPRNWFVVNGLYHTLTNEPQPAVSMRGKGYAYWHTAKFQAVPSDGEITVKFQAKNSITSSKHLIYIFEDGHYRSVGQIFADSKWRNFEIPIKTKPGSILEFQVDQPNNWQWLSIRDFRIVDAKPASSKATTRTLLKNAMHATSTNETTNDLNSSTTNFSLYLKRPIHTLEGSERTLTNEEIQYYFYHAIKTIQREANARKMDFICFIMPDEYSGRLMPAIKQLRSEGVKVIAYQPTKDEISGVKHKWYWQKADSHWTEAAVRLTADEIIRMWRHKKIVANRPFSKLLMSDYAKGFPKDIFHTDNHSLG